MGGAIIRRDNSVHCTIWRREGGVVLWLMVGVPRSMCSGKAGLRMLKDPVILACCSDMNVKQKQEALQRGSNCLIGPILMCYGSIGT